MRLVTTAQWRSFVIRHASADAHRYRPPIPVLPGTPDPVLLAQMEADGLFDQAD